MHRPFRPRPEERSGAPRLTCSEFDALFTQLREATARDPDDRRGALNNLTPAHVPAAIGELRSGRPVSLAAPIETLCNADSHIDALCHLIHDGALYNDTAPSTTAGIDRFPGQPIAILSP